MAEYTQFQWTDHTWNPWWGCQAVSPACDHCYAEALDKRIGGAHFGPGAARRRTGASNWREPAKWNYRAIRDGVRRRVFTCSMADFFDNAIDPTWRKDAWDVIRMAHGLDWQILTKRPQNIAKMLPVDWGCGWQHVWLGTTVENQAEADRRIPHLLRAPARTRFLSCEPLLEDVRLGHYDTGTAINWVICGGESGTGARPMHPQWARSLRDQCDRAGVPFLFKQWGEWQPVAPIHDADDKYENAIAQAEDRRCEIVTGNGSLWGDEECQPPDDAWMIERVGKKKAGRMLDGRTHDAFPLESDS